MFLKRITALTAAAATTLTMGMATPTYAGDNDDVARLLFGVLAAGALAHAVQESNKKTTKSTVTVTHGRHYGPDGYRSPRGDNHRNGDRRLMGPRHQVIVTRPNLNLSVPAHCERRLYTQHGPRTYVGRPCLRRANYDVGRLPRNCRRDLDFQHRRIKAWGVHCLNKAGFRLK